MTLNAPSTDDLDFAMFDIPQRTGRIVRAGTRRFVVRRWTRNGLVSVGAASTREQAEFVALPGDVIEEVAA